MSQENVEVVRKGIEAWHRHDAEMWLRNAAPEIAWMPAGPAAVERVVYRGCDEVAKGFESVWQTWDGSALRSPRFRTSASRCSGSGA